MGAPGTMASASFRESMNSLGWSRREQPAPVTPNNASSGSTGGFLSSLRGYNLFSGGGYVQLPSQESGTPPAQDGEGLFSCRLLFLFCFFVTKWLKGGYG